MDLRATFGYIYESSQTSTDWMSTDKYLLCLQCYSPSYFSSLGLGLVL